MAEETRCWSCQASADPTDNFCRRCGTGQESHLPWYYQPLGLAAALFAAGPFALPLVWRSPKLSKQGKWIATAAVTALTVYFVYGVIRMIAHLQAAITELLPLH